MLEESTFHSRDMINTASKLLSNYFQMPIHFSKIIQLSEPDRRNLILRLEINAPNTSMPEAIILKQTSIEKKDGVDEGGESEQGQLSRFAHDWAGLEFLTKIGANHAPKFYAGDLEHRFILIEDLGTDHPSLVGPLLRASTSENLQKAEIALESYMKRLGKMHADTAGQYSVFSSILNRIYPKAVRYHFIPEHDFSEIINIFKKLNHYSKELEAEINNIFIFFKSKNDFNVLLHGDICPDNVYFQGNKILFIDFEFGDFGNALIDGAYLRMAMPSCWCAKTFPSSIINRMEFLYREELKTKIISANDDAEYNKQLTYACAYWVIRSLQTLDEMELVEQEWIGSGGPVDADSLWDPTQNAARPRVLSKLDAFITLAKTTNHLPCLSTTLVSLLSYLRKVWPETKYLDLYPVFK